MGIESILINLFAFEDLSWQGSFVLFEVFLLGLVFLDAHVEQKDMISSYKTKEGVWPNDNSLYGRTLGLLCF